MNPSEVETGSDIISEVMGHMYASGGVCLVPMAPCPVVSGSAVERRVAPRVLGSRVRRFLPGGRAHTQLTAFTLAHSEQPRPCGALLPLSINVSEVVQ